MTKEPAGEVAKFYADQGAGPIIGLVLVGFACALFVSLPAI